MLVYRLMETGYSGQSCPALRTRALKIFLVKLRQYATFIHFIVYYNNHHNTMPKSLKFLNFTWAHLALLSAAGIWKPLLGSPVLSGAADSWGLRSSPPQPERDRRGPA